MQVRALVGRHVRVPRRQGGGDRPWRGGGALVHGDAGGSVRVRDRRGRRAGRDGGEGEDGNGDDALHVRDLANCRIADVPIADCAVRATARAAATRGSSRAPAARISSSCVPCSTRRPRSSTRIDVGVADRRQPVRDHERRAPAQQLVHVLLDRALGLGVERARRLVEQQHRRPVVDGARDRDPLRLAARQRAGPTRRCASRSRAAAARRTPARSRCAPPSARAPCRARRRRTRCCARSCRRTGSSPGARTRSACAASRSRASSCRARRRGSGPSVGSSSPARHLISVVLPDPLRPTIATVVPGSTSTVDVLEDRRRARPAVAEAHAAPAGSGPRAS